jgi:DNA-binding PadR family transcriptional regulator
VAPKDAGALARLLVLGTLAAKGPSHGHEIRRIVERIDMERWSEIRVGSIYHALHRLEDEGLITPLRSERDGKRPTRTIYSITPEGETELAALQDKILHTPSLSGDPFDVALWVSATQPAEALAAAVTRRIAALEELGASLADERERLTARGYLPTVGLALFRHGEIRVEAELRWHRELLELLPRLAGDAHGR